MKKKPAKKTTAKKTKSKKIALPKKDTQLEKMLIENFVSLQKVMTNLSLKFESLENKISKLLNLFEISAKALAEKNFDFGKEDKDTKQILTKVNDLSDQNKLIARGITLMNDRLSGEPEPPPEPKPALMRPAFPHNPTPAKIPPVQNPPTMKKSTNPIMQRSSAPIGKNAVSMQNPTESKYQKSISS